MAVEYSDLLALRGELIGVLKMSVHLKKQQESLEAKIKRLDKIIEARDSKTK